MTINAPFGIYEIVVLDSEKKKVDSFNLDGYKKEGTETDAMFRSSWLIVSFADREEQPRSVEVSFDSNDSNEKRVAYLRFLGLDQYGTVFIEQE